MAINPDLNHLMVHIQKLCYKHHQMFLLCTTTAAFLHRGRHRRLLLRPDVRLPVAGRRQAEGGEAALQETGAFERAVLEEDLIELEWICQTRAEL